MTPILIFLAVLILTLVVYWKKRSLAQEGRNKEIFYYFLRSSLEFLFPLTIVLFFYLGLLAVISIGWQDINLQSLIRLEEGLATIHSYTSWKLSKLMVLGLFVGIYVLGLLRLPLETRKKLYSGVEWVATWSKRAYVLFVLLCSFTLLGTQLGPVSNDLKLRIKLTRDGYADLHHQTEEALSEEVAFQLHAKTYDSFPVPYQTALKRPEEVGSRATVLQNHYAKAQSEYGVKSVKTESVLSTVEERRKAKVETEIRLDRETSTGRATVSEPEPTHLTYRKVTEAKAAITNHRQKTQGRVISFLSTVDGKKLTVQGAKVVTDLVKSGAFSHWIKTYPIAGPFIDVFFKTLDDKIKATIERTADNTARSLLQSPQTTGTMITSESSKIVSQTEIKISPETMQQAQESATKLEEELATIESAKVEVDTGIQQARNVKTEKLMAQLQSPEESVRRSAAQELSKTTDISEAKVNQLISIMRNGSRRWVTDIDRPPGHHCTDYEYTSIRYYAASALEGMKSPHVTDKIVREARTCMSNSITTTRVTDPGWI
jgi:hypothetical protein